MSGPIVYQDTGEHRWSFRYPTLVECPRCKGCAIITEHDACPGSSEKHARGGTRCTAIRGTCPSCGLVTEGSMAGELWLRTPCCGETLWAYNGRHLAVIEDYVRATVRKGISPDNERAGCRNTTVAARLPKWIITAKNRDEVLKGIARLRERLS